ncbi:transcription initiation factor-like protein (TFIID-like protein) [Leptomonas pyrrhocoris]|uniref:TATA box-binding protein-like 1 n=1 Tax=Leptomonas pyrrhocoris TaxID=157538 RepID=A0A0M9G605_LEPPY|nr:transcription initiation factor-like protein (TFIID-like protein) [Leptomonas pyrrhocoris]KPA82919.1 transcription initiation factor-like protein (TFIID-like protein) [Leptomonas pyrrhocoris]|eukprot:XP_015661358.1 transcription initiation factor-like protein (TFIID-like protein) [Leptomonas pyrrhocoris]
MDDDFDDFFNEGFEEEAHADVPFAHPPVQLGSAAAAEFGDVAGLDDGTQIGSSAAINLDGDEVPLPIANVQEYLPNVSPDAFPVVVAVQAQASISVGIDLAQLSCATRNVEYMPNNRIPSATMRLHEPTAVVMVHNSGALNIIGAASVSEARQAAELAARVIRKALNLDFTSLKFRVRSITARFNVCSPVRLNELARYQVDPATSVGVAVVQGSYEPERFNGCVLRFLGKSTRGDNQWSVSCSVFVTGKVQLMGARSMDELRFAFHAFVPVVAQYLGTTNTAAS